MTKRIKKILTTTLTTAVFVVFYTPLANSMPIARTSSASQTLVQDAQRTIIESNTASYRERKMSKNDYVLSILKSFDASIEPEILHSKEKQDLFSQRLRANIPKLQIKEGSQNNQPKQPAQSLPGTQKANVDGVRENEFLLIVDASFDCQCAALAFVSDNGQVFSSSAFKVSTGDSRKFHYLTPSGYFEHSIDTGTYRALGTPNEHGIRGIGLKGARVWDLGWQKTTHAKSDQVVDIRFQLHATDPVLEAKLGTPQSQGCIRLSAGVNYFLDTYAILDKDFLKDQKTGKPYWALRDNRFEIEHVGSIIYVIPSVKTKP